MDKGKRKWLIMGLLFLIIIGCIGSLVFNYRKSYADQKNVVSFKANRALLQKYVISVAKQYLYKNTYTDYEQHGVDDNNSAVGYSTFMFRTFTSTPEDISRTNIVNLDCSSFITTVYRNALGYYFGDYFSLTSNNNYYFNSSYKYLKQKSSKNYFRYGTMYTGKGNSTFMLEKIASKGAGAPKAGVIYNGNKYSSLVPFYYKLLGNEDSSKRTKVYSNFESILQDGDVFVIRYKNGASTAGHVMIYTDSLEDSNGKKMKGFIHSTGVDFNFDTPSKGDDKYSVRFMPYDEFKNYEKSGYGYIFATRSNGKVPTAVTVLRPINEVLGKKYTNFYNNTYGSLVTSHNVVALNDLSDLSFEEFASRKIGNSERLVSKYNSVNKSEEVKYNLYVDNNSSSLAYTISISDIIPISTDYVGCTEDCSLDKKTGKISWNDVTLPPGASRKFSYSVIVKQENKRTITNSGMKVVSHKGNTLTMPDIKIDVDKTNRDKEQAVLYENITKIKDLINKKHLSIDAKAPLSNYKILYNDLSSAKKSTITRASVIKSLYYNSFGIDLGTLSKYKDEIFVKIPNGYARRTDGKIGTNKLNPMLVDGLYGGRKVRGNVGKDRTTLMNLEDLEIGDIIIMDAVANSYIFLGKNTKTGEYEFVDNYLKIYSGSISKTLLRKSFTYDTFVVLRPSKVYNVKIKGSDDVPTCSVSSSKNSNGTLYVDDTWTKHDVSMIIKCQSNKGIRKIISKIERKNVITNRSEVLEDVNSNVHVLTYVSNNHTFRIDKDEAYIYTWSYKAVDSDGKVSDLYTTNIKIDKIKPTIGKFSICRKSDGRREIRLNCLEKESGVNTSKSYIKFTDYNDKVPSMKRIISNKHNYTAVCYDEAGNSSNVKTGTFLKSSSSDRVCD